MEKSLARYIWTHTRSQQLWVLFVVAISMVTYFLSFDLPKLIVNIPIQGKGFESAGATQIFMHIAFDVPFIGHLEIFRGVELGRVAMLVALSTVFLLLVIVNGFFKYYINTYKGRLGERMLRRLRFALIDRVLRFPPSQFKRVKPSEIATMIKDEVEPLGGFIGDAFVQPVLLGGQAVTALVFILVQSPWLGLIALLIVAAQGFFVPKLRRRLIVLGRARQLTARELSGRVGEVVDGIAAVHTHDTSNFERADFSARLGRIFKIRYDIYQWKFFVKFLNNFLAQITPYLFYLIGGYLAIRGQLDVGQLVAVIGAYKDLPGPLKELIDWDQSRQDVEVKYAQVVEQFTMDGVLAPHLQALSPVAPGALRDPLSAANLTVTDESGTKLLERVSMAIQPGEAVALVGTTSGGAEVLAEILARLVLPESGKITVGSDDLAELPESVTGRRISYASSEAFMFQGSLRDNLYYSLKHAPLRPADYDDAARTHRKWEIDEAGKAGNPDHDINDDWIDYAAAGATGPEDLLISALPVLEAVLLSQDILVLGMRSTVNAGHHPELLRRVVELRTALRDRLAAEGLGGLIAQFEPGAFNPEATIVENLLFGAATGPELSGKELASNAYFRSVLLSTGLDETLYGMGLEIAANSVELFRDLPPDHPFFQQLSFMSSEEIPQYEALLQSLRGKTFASVNDLDRARMIKLSFAYVEPRHRFGLLDAELMKRIVEARHEFNRSLPEELKGAIEGYDPLVFIKSATLIDNVLFGRVSNKHADGHERVFDMVRDILHQTGLYNDVLNNGLDFNVGVGGKRLSAAQRQKLNLARALLKRADFLVLNRPLSALDSRLQQQIVQNVIALTGNLEQRPAIAWVLAAPGLASYFERIAVFDKGYLVEDGSFDKLMARGGVLKDLLS